MNSKPRLTGRIFLLLTALVSAYQVAVAIEGLNSLEIICYTIGFGILIISSLLLLILGYEILGTAPVVILATLIPLSIAGGLIAQFHRQFFLAYLIYAGLGLTLIFLTRIKPLLMLNGKTRFIPVGAVAFVHALAGILIVFIPLQAVWQDWVEPGFVLVSFGGAFIGLDGILLFMLRSGKTPISQERLIAFFPIILFVTTTSFTLGFAFR
jgi:hypothetical protein